MYKMVNGVRSLMTPEEIAALQPSVSDLRDQKKLEIEADYRKSYQDISSQYIPEERDTWSEQIADALAFTADPAAETLFLDGMVARTGEDKGVLAGAILAKRKIYKQAISDALGQYQSRLAVLSKIDLTSKDAADKINAV